MQTLKLPVHFEQRNPLVKSFTTHEGSFGPLMRTLTDQDIHASARSSSS